MLKQIVRLRVGLVVLLGGLLVCSSASAMGNDYGGRNRRDNRGDNGGDNRGVSTNYGNGERHYYRDGNWYRRDSTGRDIAVAALAIGALIDSLPPKHEVIVVDGNQYYHDDRYYYRQEPHGAYVVVAPPRR